MILGFCQGEEFSEHTASMPAILHFIHGEAKLTLGDDRHEAKAGTWGHMPTGQPRDLRVKDIGAVEVEEHVRYPRMIHLF